MYTFVDWMLLALLLEHEGCRKTRVIISLFDQLRDPDDVDVHTFLSCESLKSLKKHCFYKQNRLLAFHCYENIIVQIDDSIFCRKHRSGPKTLVIVTYSASMNYDICVFCEVLDYTTKSISIRF